MRAILNRLSFEDDRLFYLVLAMSAAPVWLFKYLPGVDLPGHAAQVAALLEVWRGNPLFTGLFDINLRTPYVTATLVSAALSYLMPVNVAIKSLLSVVIVGTPLLFGALARSTGGSPHWRWLVIPSTYGFAFYWGFFPFLVAVPLGLAFLLLAIEFEKRPTLPLGLGVAAFSLLLLASHILVLCFSSLLALAWIVASNAGNPRRMVRICIPFTTPLPLIAIWMSTTLASGTYVSSERILFGPMLLRLRHLLVQPSGTDGSVFFLSLAITATIFAIPLLCKARLTDSPAKWSMAICGLAVFLVFPSMAMGTVFLYQRFGLYVPLLWFLLWERGEEENRNWHWLGMTAVACCLFAVSLQMSAFNAETRGFDKIAESIERGKRVASLPVVNRSRHFVYPSYLHFTSWYQAVGRGIVDYNFAQFYGTIVIYKKDHRSPFGTEVQWQPGSFDWDANAGNIFDYFVVHANLDVSEPIFKEHRYAVELVSQHGWWWLYKRIDRVSADNL